MATKDLPTTSIGRGLAAFLFMNVMRAIPAIIGMKWPEFYGPNFEGQLWAVRVAVALAEPIGGLSIAFGSDWLRRRFWASETGFVDCFRKRAWALLPYILAGITGSIFMGSIFSKEISDPRSIFGMFSDSIGLLLSFLILIAMLRKKMGYAKAALTITGIFLFFSVFILRYRHWANFEILGSDFAYFIGQLLFNLGVLAFLRNSRGALFVVWAFLLANRLLASAFSVYSSTYGDLILAFTGLASAAALFWLEGAEEFFKKAPEGDARV